MALLNIPDASYNSRRRFPSGSSGSGGGGLGKPSRTVSIADGLEDDLLLEDQLSLEQLEKLGDCFQENTATIDKSGSVGLSLNVNQFKIAIRKILRTDVYDEYSEDLCRRIANYRGGKATLTWYDVVEFLANHMERKCRAKYKTDAVIKGEQKFMRFQHGKRQCVVRILTTSSPFLYLFVGKVGAVKIYGSDLHYQQTFNVNLEIVEETDEAQQFMRTTVAEVTDASYMGNCLCYCIASTSRIIHFVDCSASAHWESFRLVDIPAVPMCLQYWFDTEDEEGESKLFCGDLHGNIYLFTFLQPVTSLFWRQEMEGTENVAFGDLPEHKEFVKCHVFPKVHTDSIRKIVYVPSMDSMFSSSTLDRQRPIAFRHLWLDKEPYIYRPSKGVDCFDYNRELNLVVTGSKDFYIRGWDLYMPKKPIWVFKGHMATVIDVHICYKRNLLFSCCTEGELRVWHIRDRIFLQRIYIQFPSYTAIEKHIEYGVAPFFFDTPDGTTFLLSCSDYTIVCRLQEMEVDADVSEKRMIQQHAVQIKLEEEGAPKSTEKVIRKSNPEVGLKKNKTDDELKIDDIINSRTIYFTCSSLPDQSKPATTEEVKLTDEDTRSSESKEMDSLQEVTTDGSTDQASDVLPFLQTTSDSIESMRRLSSVKLNESSPVVRRKEEEMNTKEGMKEFAANGCPFSALKIYPLREIHLPLDKWPVSRRMRKLGLTCSNDVEFRKLDLTPLERSEKL